MTEVSDTIEISPPIGELIRLHQKVQTRLRDLEEQFCVQVGAAKAAFEFECFIPKYEHPIEEPPPFPAMRASIDQDEYAKIIQTSGYSQTKDEACAFINAIGTLRLLADFAQTGVSRNKIETLTKIFT